MQGLDVNEFEWDDANEPHCAAHGVWPEDLDDALTSNEYTAVRNRRGRDWNPPIHWPGSERTLCRRGHRGYT